MYNYDNESSEGKGFVSSPMKSERKGKAKIFIYKNYNYDIRKISNVFPGKIFVGLNINDSSENRTNSKNIGKCKVNLSEIIIREHSYKYMYEN